MQNYNPNMTNSIVDLDGNQQDLSYVKRSNDDDEYWQDDQNNPLTNSTRAWDDFDSIVPNYEDDEESNGFITEEKCSIGFVPDQPDNLFAFPNGKDVLDNSLFHNNHNNIDNDEADVGSNVVLNTIYGAIYDRSDDTNPLPLLPEHSPHPSIMLHDGII